MIKTSEIKVKLLEKIGSYNADITHDEIKDILFDICGDEFISIHYRIRQLCLIGNVKYDSIILKNKIIRNGGIIRVNEIRKLDMESDTGEKISSIPAFEYLVQNDCEVEIYITSSDFLFSMLACVGDTKPLLSATGYYPPTKDIDKINQACEKENERLRGDS